MMPMNLVFCHYNWPLVFLFSWKSQEDVLRFNYFSYEFDWIFFSSLLLQLSRRFYLLIAVIFNPNWFILIFRVFTHFSFMHTRCLMNCLCDYRFTLCWCLCDYRLTLCWYLCGYRFTHFEEAIKIAINWFSSFEGITHLIEKLKWFLFVEV